MSLEFTRVRSTDRTLLNRLRSQIHDRENARHAHRAVDLGWSPSNARIRPDILFAGMIHEWMLDCAAAPGLGPFVILFHITRRALQADPARSVVVCIGEGCRNAAQAALPQIHQTLWVDAASLDERVWAADLALRCTTIAAVIIDAYGFDMAATRRLQLAAEAGGTLGLLSRPATEKSLSAAATRWLVRPTASFSPTIHPRWSVELLRCKGLQSTPDAPPRWIVECNDAQGPLSLSAEPAGRSEPTPAAAARNRLRRTDAG